MDIRYASSNEPSSSTPAWGVAALLLAAQDALQARLGAVTIHGELSGFNRAASGHCYFNLKDSDGRAAMLRCAMFRRAASLMDFKPADGQQVELRGRVTVYEARGELQCVVEAMRPLGAGSLYELFLRLKAKLEAEGLFDATHKRVLPPHPRRLGLVTSLQAAALHDVLSTLARRAPQVAVVVYPASVQGVQAPDELVRAISLANARHEVDALLICRGGGSIEDLWAFNDERVVRAIAASALPTISGVGHESDVTLADLAADLRAPTPTAAAELAAPEQSELQRHLEALQRRAQRASAQRLDGLSQDLDGLSIRLNQGLVSLHGHRQRLALLAQRAASALLGRAALAGQSLSHGEQAWRRAQGTDRELRQQRLCALGQRLALLDPQHVLARGYALIEMADGALLISPDQLKTGAHLKLSLAQGQAELVACQVGRL